MKYKDLSFNIINDNGLSTICDITAVIPNLENSNEPYVTYTDYMLDENDEFLTYYGQIIEENSEPKLRRIVDINEINKIKKIADDEIVKYVNEQVQDNLS